MSNYGQTRSFNLGIAEDTSIEAALIYDDLVYAEATHGKNKWFFRSYEQLNNRLKLSESTLRRHIKKLVDAGWIDTKVKKVNGTPTIHFFLNRHIDRMETVNLTETMETVNLTETIYNRNYITTHKDSDSSLSDAATKSAGVVEDTSKTLLEECIAILGTKEIVTKARLKKMNGRLADVKGDADQIRRAAVALSKAPWHIENKQVLIDNLIGPDKFGRWHTLGQDEIIPNGSEDAAKKEKDRLWKLDADLEADAFREDRREEYWAARDSGQLPAYLEKYGLDDVYVL